MAPVLELRGVDKAFSGQQALAGASLIVDQGEVHALIGQNGSGKSTLIKTLAGYQEPDAYEVARVAGEDFKLGSPTSAASLGLRFIHQNLGLLDNMSAVENCSLSRGFPTAAGWRIRWAQERRRVHDLLLEFGVELDAGIPVGRLKPAERTTVAIVRALQDWERSARLLVLDEATASLPVPEVARLFDVLRQVVAKGIGVVYVSHRLDEIIEIADRVTILRDGRNVATKEVREVDQAELVSLMIGRPLEALFAEPPEPSSDVVLAVEGLQGEEVEELSFEVRAGEIVGIAGILGSGREEVAGLLFGAVPALSGTFTDRGPAGRSPGARELQGPRHGPGPGRPHQPGRTADVHGHGEHDHHRPRPVLPGRVPPAPRGAQGGHDVGGALRRATTAQRRRSRHPQRRQPAEGDPGQVAAHRSEGAAARRTDPRRRRRRQGGDLPAHRRPGRARACRSSSARRRTRTWPTSAIGSWSCATVASSPSSRARR